MFVWAPRKAAGRHAGSGRRPCVTLTSLHGQQQAGPDTSLLRGRFMIPADEVQRALASQQYGSSRMEDLLFALIQPAALLARSPVSGYHVG